MQVWRQAATQVFFALGLGYGSVIAYSSYNPVHNNCHRDALMVSAINFMTSVLATLVVFVVLGFRAKTIALGCVAKYGKYRLSECVSVCLSEREYWYLYRWSLSIICHAAFKKTVTLSILNYLLHVILKTSTTKQDEWNQEWHIMQ